MVGTAPSPVAAARKPRQMRGATGFAVPNNAWSVRMQLSHGRIGAMQPAQVRTLDTIPVRCCSPA